MNLAYGGNEFEILCASVLYEYHIQSTLKKKKEFAMQLKCLTVYCKFVLLLASFSF